MLVEPYRCLNLSTLPVESTSFCLPVKKGWLALDMSSFTSGYSFPSSQVIVSDDLIVDLVRNAKSASSSLKTTSLYSGCISFLTIPTLVYLLVLATSFKNASLFLVVFNLSINNSVAAPPSRPTRTLLNVHRD